MKCQATWLFYALVGACLGCAPSGFNSEGYRSAMQSGFHEVPESLEIEGIYGESHHMLGKKKGDVYIWNTDKLVEGRYEFTMQQEVRLNESRTAVLEAIGEPAFHVAELESVKVLPDGRAQAYFSLTNQKNFTLDEWRSIKESAGDLSVIGVEFIKGKPVPNSDKYRQQRLRDRVTVRPDM